MSRILIVDNDTTTIQVIVGTLAEADRPYVIAATTAEAQQAIEVCPDITLALLRFESENIDGRELCRWIRQTKPPAQLAVIAILREEQLELAADMLSAGANDLLLDPFEPRELRMRANIVPSDQRRRVDAAHATAASADEPRLYVPVFDPATHRLSFGPYEDRKKRWEADETVTKVLLDRIIVCPECEAIPTFRPGCEVCGSAWSQEQTLIHHYACAYVGPESEFHTASGLACPKCHLQNLVAGSDFEQTRGCLQCADCQTIFAEQKMIAHCLGCQHRFAAKDGLVQEIHGYQVERPSQAALISSHSFHFGGAAAQTSTQFVPNVPV